MYSGADVLECVSGVAGQERQTDVSSNKQRAGSVGGEGVGGESGDERVEGRETVVISAHEFQWLKALATPIAASVRDFTKGLRICQIHKGTDFSESFPR
jgi:hypothetical protein